MCMLLRTYGHEFWVVIKIIKIIYNCTCRYTVRYCVVWIWNYHHKMAPCGIQSCFQGERILLTVGDHRWILFIFHRFKFLATQINRATLGKWLFKRLYVFLKYGQFYRFLPCNFSKIEYFYVKPFLSCERVNVLQPCASNIVRRVYIELVIVDLLLDPHR